MNEEVRRYLDAVPEERKPLFDQLHALIMELYPNAEVVLSYQVPTYRAKSGWVALGVWKEGVSLYTNGLHHIAEFKAKYPAIKTGKGSINFKASDVVPVAALKKVIRRAIEHPKHL
ncbi:MAG: iron chaperone [Pyrinomonadaceae bacterium]